MKRLAGSAMLCVALAGLSACGDMRPTDTGRATSGGTNVSVPQVNPIVGKWSFTRYFSDDAGNIHLSQTVWEFRAGGYASKTLYSDNVTAGVGDVIIQEGSWSTSGNTVQVLFNGSAPVAFEYHFEGSTILVLAGTAFARIP